MCYSFNKNLPINSCTSFPQLLFHFTDLKVLAVFKNYSPGVPSCRLYVKNISKHAAAKDLHFIYGRFSRSSDDNDDYESNMYVFTSPSLSLLENFVLMYCFFLGRYDIRLMTEGRMKGQAFVTLPSTKLAQQALEETNGYILKDKPLVVQFARSAPASVGTQGTS